MKVIFKLYNDSTNLTLTKLLRGKVIAQHIKKAIPSPSHSCKWRRIGCDQLLNQVDLKSVYYVHVVESVREPCVEKGFVPIFLGVLNKDENVECVLQSCRALGNMCFDNGKLRVSRSPLVRDFTNQLLPILKISDLDT